MAEMIADLREWWLMGSGGCCKRRWTGICETRRRSKGSAAADDGGVAGRRWGAGRWLGLQEQSRWAFVSVRAASRAIRLGFDGGKRFDSVLLRGGIASVILMNSSF